MEESLKEKTAKGLFWSGMNNLGQQVVGVVFGIVMARWLLKPEDYGMMAMITVFPLIATTLQNSGFKTALINQAEVRDEDYNSVFWFNIVVGCALYVLLFCCAPLIARYYHTPELVALSRYAFLNFVFASFGTAQAAYLTKRMKNKEIAQTGITAVLLSSLTGLLLAWMGLAYWALATQSIVFIGVNTALLWYHSDWRPTWHIDFGPMKRMFGFSVKILVSAIATQINSNVMNILLGRYYRAQTVGYYNQGYQWSFKAYSLIQGMVMQIDQTVLVGLNNERERQLAVLRKMIRFTAFIAFPLLLGFALVAHEFIILTIKEAWEPCVPLLQTLCVSGAFMPLSVLLYDFIISKGRSDLYMWNTIALGGCLITTVILLHPYGIGTMVWGFALVNIGWMFIWFFFASRLSGYRLVDFLKDTVPFALTACGVMCITYLATRSLSNLLLLFIARMAIAALLYYAVMRIAHVKILDDCLQFIAKKFKKK